MNNPLTQPGKPPKFLEISNDLIEPTLQFLLKEAEENISALEAGIKPTWSGTLMAVHQGTARLNFAWGIVEHLMSVRNSDVLREIHDRLQPEIISFQMRVGQSQPLFGGLSELRNGQGWEELSEDKQRVVEKEILGMKHSGINLQGEDKERFNTWQRRLGELSTRFMNNVLDSTKAFELVLTSPAEVEGLPQSFRAMVAQSAQSHGHPDATPEDGPWRISLDAPIVMPFLQHARNTALREQVYTAYVTRASGGDHNNQPLIDEILSLRKQSATLLGYDTFAEMSVASKMAADVSAVDALEEKLRVVSYQSACGDHQELERFAATFEKSAPLKLHHWDIAFYSERLKEEKYSLSDEILRPYFQFPKVLSGLFSLAEKLFEIKVVEADGQEQVWQEDVRFFEVQTPAGEKLANFYLDPYSRPAEKRGGAWMNAFYGRESTPDHPEQLPLALLVCNQTPPVGATPSLMSFREVTTLFHEFGHGLQHMLTEVTYPQAAGINNVEWDAVELPSQFMENWCYHQETLLGLTSHVESGEQLPIELFEKIVAAKNFRAGSGFLRQLYFGNLDMELHHRYTPGDKETVADVKNRIASTHTVLPPLEQDRFLCSFGHIFAGGYAAGYYSYKWAEVLSADAFSAFEEIDLNDQQALSQTGLRFRRTVLALGGSLDPNQVFIQFRGRPPSVDALLRHNGLESAPN